MLRRMGTNKKVTRVRQILAANMRRARAELGISQEQLAELAELHRTYVSTVERCQRNIGIDGVERIARALNMSVADLLQE
jgi:transcriptional regulator with XRE-family HTH domain